MRYLARVFGVLGLLSVTCLVLGQAGATSAQTILSSSATGLTGHSTAQMRLTDHPHHVLMGQVIIARQGDDRVQALSIAHVWDGVHRLRFDQAWADGVALPYQPIPRAGLACAARSCRTTAVGVIFLSTAAFAHVQTHGLRARLTGPSGAIDIAAPAALFRDAARMAQPGTD